MTFSTTGQEEVTFKYRWLLNRSDHMGRFDYVSVQSFFIPKYWIVQYNVFTDKDIFNQSQTTNISGTSLCGY